MLIQFTSADYKVSRCFLYTKNPAIVAGLKRA